jgi:DNA-binding winged helix-turn-helix (wHTH) protein
VIYRFENFELDSDAYQLRRDGATVEVEPQVFGVLWHLVAHAGRLATKDDLLAAVWGTTFVSDAALTTRIKRRGRR